MGSSPVSQDDLPRAAILRMEGTNCEEEAFHSFRRSGAEPRYVHIKELESGRTSLDKFDIIFLPGGFSAGDYIRAGAIFSMRLKNVALKDLMKISDESKPIVGVCNGFQVLTEIGMLPFSGRAADGIALTVNESNRFECRNTFMKLRSKNRIFSTSFSTRSSWEVPVAHSEGRIAFSSPKALETLRDNDQILFGYVDPEGNDAGYPWNPNGSVDNIAAISNEYGNVLGLMPHPERIYHRFQCENRDAGVTTGKAFFDAIVSYSKNLRA